MQGQSSLFVPDPRSNWWPSELGSPSATGSQNNLKYAYFAGSRRLAVDSGGGIWVYDTQDHQIGGFGQQQGLGNSIVFTSQYGTVNLSSLPVVSRNGQPVPSSLPVYAPSVGPPPPPSSPSPPDGKHLCGHRTPGRLESQKGSSTTRNSTSRKQSCWRARTVDFLSRRKRLAAKSVKSARRMRSAEGSRDDRPYGTRLAYQPRVQSAKLFDFHGRVHESTVSRIKIHPDQQSQATRLRQQFPFDDLLLGGGRRPFAYLKAAYRCRRQWRTNAACPRSS